MKKFLALALTAVLLVGTLASCASGKGNPDAIDSYVPEVDYLVDDKGNTFRFEEAEGETAILVKYEGKATKDDKVVIPATFNGRTVAAIGDEAFYNLAAVASVEIPDTVLSIGDHAFASCTSLTSIKMPKGLLSIGEKAFANCDQLETVDLGESIKSIGKEAFYRCSALTTIELPGTLESIGSYSFAYCESLKTLEIPTSVTSIGTLAYYECAGLESIKLHDGITELGEFIFVMKDSTMKDKIDTSNLTEGKVLDYVNNMAAPEADTTPADESAAS